MVNVLAKFHSGKYTLLVLPESLRFSHFAVVFPSISITLSAVSCKNCYLQILQMCCVCCIVFHKRLHFSGGSSKASGVGRGQSSVEKVLCKCEVLLLPPFSCSVTITVLYPVSCSYFLVCDFQPLISDVDFFQMLCEKLNALQPQHFSYLSQQ